MHIVVYSDGGARGNPGPAAYGVILYKRRADGNLRKITDVSSFLGETTNNQAEYKGVIAGLKKAKEIGARKVTFNMDSELIAKQLTREYKVKNKELQPLFLEAWNLIQKFEKVTIQHIPREQNKEADALVNKVLDKIM